MSTRVQFLLVGLALRLFYLLLLSLSEHVGFSAAYAIAAAAVLVTAYVRKALCRPRPELTIGTFLSALYDFLYVLLQIQDYALNSNSTGATSG